MIMVELNFYWLKCFKSTSSKISLPYEVEKKSIKHRRLYLSIFYKFTKSTYFNYLNLGSDHIFYSRLMELSFYGKEVNPSLNFLRLWIILKKIKSSNKNKIVINLYDVPKNNEQFIIRILKDHVFQVYFCNNEANLAVSKKSHDCTKWLTTYISNIVYGVLWLIRQNFLNKKFNTIKEYTKKFDYFYINYLDQSRVVNGRFMSPYWDSLPEENFERNGKQHCFIHYHVYSSKIGTLEDAHNLIKKTSSKSGEGHIFINDPLSLYQLMKIIAMYTISAILLPLVSAIAGIYSKKNIFIYAHKDYIRENLSGLEYARSLYFRNQIINVFSDIEGESLFIPMEGLAWEKNVVFQARKKFKKIYGYSFSPIRFWDFRFYNWKILKNTNNLKSFFPDFLCIWDEISFKLMSEYLTKESSESNSPRLKKVKSTRYAYLDKYSGKENINFPIKILIVTDFTDDYAGAHLDTLIDCGKEFSDRQIKFYVKPHPNLSINVVEKYKFLELIDSSVMESIDNYDIVYAGSGTTAALEAYRTVKNVFYFFDTRYFNYSPLRDFKDVCYVTSAQEVIDKIQTIIEKKISHHDVYK